MATSAEIKTLFKTYFDAFSFNFSNNQLNSIFEKAQNIYWGKLSDKWGISLENEIDLQPIIEQYNVVTIANPLPLTSLPNYNRIGVLKPTFVVNGKSYTFPAKPLNANNRYSPLAQGTVRYPRYYLVSDSIVIQPDLVPTAIYVEYLRDFYQIDFNDPLTDIPITQRNVQGILEEALRVTGNMQREFDYANQIANENIINNQ